MLRDLVWLLNGSAHTDDEGLDEFPEVEKSVFNFGKHGLSGLVSSSLDPNVLEEEIARAIHLFEPRIIPETLVVRASSGEKGGSPNVLAFEIQGELWAQPFPEKLFPENGARHREWHRRVCKSAAGLRPGHLPLPAMHRSFLRLYNNELHHLRHMAAEFARDYPKIAGRLALDTEAKEACQDPFVERLLEGFAFLTARVQLKLDAEFPQFTDSLLETVYPHYLCPTPSLAVVRIEPDRRDAGPPEGFLIPRGSAMRSSSVGERDAVRVSHRARGAPLAAARSPRRAISRAISPSSGCRPRPAAGRRSACACRRPPGVKLKSLKLDRLPIHLRGLDDLPVSIYEQIFAQCSQIAIKLTSKEGAPGLSLLPAGHACAASA